MLAATGILFSAGFLRYCVGDIPNLPRKEREKFEKLVKPERKHISDTDIFVVIKSFTAKFRRRSVRYCLKVTDNSL